MREGKVTPYDPFKKEHDEIMEILTRLTPGINGGSVVSRLIDHLSQHFIDEDRMMRDAQYPGRDKHLEDHHLIQDVFLAHIPRIVSGNMSQEELDLMLERLLLHIRTEDAYMMKYICTYAPEVLPPQ